MKVKSKKPVTVGELIPCDSNAANEIVYINNHATPSFGKLLQEGRKAAKSGDIHSCWLNAYGCQLKFEENGKHHMYRTVDELKKLTTARKAMKPKAKPSTKRSTPDDRSPDGGNVKAKK